MLWSRRRRRRQNLPTSSERLALLAYQRGETVAVNALDDADAVRVPYVPLKAPMRVRGVLVVTTARRQPVVARSRSTAMLSTVASLVAIAVERLHYVDVANHAQMEMASERLRNVDPFRTVARRPHAA